MIGAAASAALAREIAINGSRPLLSAVGRAFGLGEAEQNALSSGRIPAWFWISAGLAMGFVAGVQVYKRWPDKVPQLIKGT